MADADGLDEAAEQILRVGLTAAAQLAERIAQARTQAQRETAARSEREARELAGRVAAERAAAAVQLDRTRNPRWITTATAAEIADAYATARQWAGVDPAAGRDAQRILDQVHARYGPDAVPTALDHSVDGARVGGGDSPARRAASAEAALLLATPDVDARVRAWLTDHPGSLPGLTPAKTTEAVDARLRAELSQGRPATAATTVTASATAPVTAEPTISRTWVPTIGVSGDLERD